MPKSYYCKLCDCKFQDANTRDAHLKGKRHRMSYKVKARPMKKKDIRKISFFFVFIYFHRKKLIHRYQSITIKKHRI